MHGTLTNVRHRYRRRRKQNYQQGYQGVRIYARLGRVTLAAAEDHLRRRIAEIEEEEKRESAARRTFGKACVRYLTEKAAKRSIDTDAYHIGVIEPWLGKLELVAIHNARRNSLHSESTGLTLTR